MPRCGIIRGFCPRRINKKRQRVLPFYGGRIRLTAIADRECRGHNRVQPGYAAVRHYPGVLPSPDKQKRQRVLPFYGGRRGIRLTAIADRECQGHNRVQPGYAAVRHYSGVLPSPINKKGNGCCLFMAEGEGFEPPDTFASTVFKTAAFDRSASLPCLQIIS